MPVARDGTVHFSTTLLALVRESLDIKMGSGTQFDLFHLISGNVFCYILRSVLQINQSINHSVYLYRAKARKTNGIDRRVKALNAPKRNSRRLVSFRNTGLQLN